MVGIGCRKSGRRVKVKVGGGGGGNKCVRTVETHSGSLACGCDGHSHALTVVFYVHVVVSLLHFKTLTVLCRVCVVADAV